MFIWKPAPSNYSFNLVVVSVFAGRRRKGYNSLLMYPLLLGGTFIPLAFGALALLAGKALIVSKLALALAAIVGLKKLVGGGGGESYQVGPWKLFLSFIAWKMIILRSKRQLKLIHSNIFNSYQPTIIDIPFKREDFHTIE